MEKIAVAGLAACAILAVTPAAHAAVNPTGLRCGLLSLTDPRVAGSQTGEVDAELVLTDDTDPARTYTGYVTCTVQTGSDDTHAEADAAVLRGEPGVGPVVTVAGAITYEVAEDEEVYVCTEVVTDGGTRYWDAWTEAWSTDSRAGCEIIGAWGDPGPGGPGPDPTVCPVFALAFPPEGDIVLPALGKQWDCPPYDA